MIWVTDLIPNIGDEIIIEPEFLCEKDKKYFPPWASKFSHTLLVKKRTWNTGEKEYYWNGIDLELSLDWTEEESVNVKKYLDNFNKIDKLKRQKVTKRN